MTLFTKTKHLNLDITNRCPMLCPECQRQQYPESRKFGGDMSIENFQKIINYFDMINFCGQRSDPVHHPQFLTFLKMCKEQKIITAAHNASTHKPMEWYKEAFKTNPAVRWWLALDGKPWDSPKYRINQDGYKMFEIMKLAAKMCTRQPYWQCIRFNYNQHYIDELSVTANEIGAKLIVIESHRWDAIPWLKPEN